MEKIAINILMVFLISLFCATFALAQSNDNINYNQILCSKKLNVVQIDSNEYEKLFHSTIKNLLKIENYDSMKRYECTNEYPFSQKFKYLYEFKIQSSLKFEQIFVAFDSLYKSQNELSDIKRMDIVNDFGRGAYVSMNPSDSAILFIYVNQCVFHKEAQKTLKSIRRAKSIKTLYRFNCGGKVLIDRWP